MNFLVTMCLLGGGVFLVTFIGNTVLEVVRKRKESAPVDDTNNEV